MTLPTNPARPLYNRKKLIGCTVETSEGTYATTSAAAAIFANDIKCTLVDPFNDGERVPQGNYLGEYLATRGSVKAKLTFTMECRSGDALPTLMKACGCVVATGNVITPTSSYSARKFLSFAVWEDGRVKRLRGCSGNVTFEFKNGGRLFAKFEFSGVPVLTQITGGDVKWAMEEAMPSQPTIVAKGYVCQAATLTLGAATGDLTPIFASFSLKVNNSIGYREWHGDLAGFLSAFIHEIKPGISIDPEANLVADHDAYRKLLSSTTFALNCVLSDGTNSATIAASKCQRKSIGDDERDGRLIDSIEASCAVTNGNDQFSITVP